MSLLVDGAAWTALAAVIAMIVLALRRRLAVSRNQPSGAPLRWLASPGRAPMLHRRLRASVASVRSIVPPPSRRRGTSPWEADAAEVERLAAHLARELVRAARLPLVARHRALTPIATRVREHEAQARELGGFAWTAFCAVQRDANDPRRPPGYRPLDEFWRARGYVRRPDLVTTFDWKDVGDAAPSSHPMLFWLRACG